MNSIELDLRGLGELVAGMLGLIILLILIGLFIQAGFLLWGARIAGIEDRSFGKAFGTIILGGICSFVLGLILSPLLILGAVLSLIGSFLIEGTIVAGIFNTSYGKGLGAIILSWILSAVVFGGIALLFFAFFFSQHARAMEVMSLF